MKKKQAKKKEPRAFGRIIQAEGFKVEKILFEDRSGSLRIVGETSEWGIVRISLQHVVDGVWKEIRKLSYAEAMKLEKTIGKMRKLLNV